MKPALALALACLLVVHGDYVEVFPQEGAGLITELQDRQPVVEEQIIEIQQPVTVDTGAEDTFSDTLYVVDEKPSGSYRVTGMFQNVQSDASESQPMMQLLERPRISFFDLSWSSWVDERLQFMDLVQELLSSPGPSRCPHMQPEGTSLDTGMVSYLASSRFGPAILTTYAQKFQDTDGTDFDYNDVHIPESAMSKSYEDASLLEDLSANANEAFQQAESDSRSLFQKDNLGFFAANLKAEQAKGLFQNSQLDGEYESVQSTVNFPVTYFSRANDASDTDLAFEDVSTLPYTGSQVDEFVVSDQLGNCIFFVLLLIGCLYVWISLARSCCTTFCEAKQRRRDQKSAAYSLAQKELLVPLNPEKPTGNAFIETAAMQAPEGSYYAPSGTGFQKVVVPLSTV